MDTEKRCINRVMNVNFGENIHTERIIDTAAKNFSQELKSGIKPKVDSFIGGNKYQLFATQTEMMQQELLSNSEVAVAEVGELGKFSKEIINSVLESQPDNTRKLIYAVKTLKNRGNSRTDIFSAISQAVEEVPPEKCNENMKGELKDYIKSLVEHFIREYGEKITENGVGNEKKVASVSSYIYTRDNGLERGKGGIVDYMLDPEIGVEAYCCSSFEAIDSYGSPDYGEDRVGFFRVDDHIVLIEADGVSQSFMGSYASHEAVSEIVKKGGLDLVDNVQMAGERLKEIHNDLIIPNDVAPMLKKVLDKKKNIFGSQTMLNQISINLKTGGVDACFMGDGGLTLLRKDGSRVDYDCAVKTNGKGDSMIRLSTLGGLIGRPANLESVGAKDLTLSSGDTILLYSDGVTKSMLTEIEKINRSDGDFKREIPKLIESLRSSREKDDDRSLLVFRMK